MLRLRRYREWNKEYFDSTRNIRAEALQAGDLVLVFDSRRNNNIASARKLAPRWRGPFRISKAQEGLGSYRLEELDDQFPNNKDYEDSDTPEESGEEAPTANPEERPLPEESSGNGGLEEEEEEEEGESVLMHFTVIGHWEILQMFYKIARRYKEAFPLVNGRRLLYRENFDRILD
ncbi:hypothetical protein M433DRAFT_7970 [Acidomyces richmondensis BFW]|nr:hypothetical protein M433DRAFT_7970 [Acidomyces richmondensis BFW]